MENNHDKYINFDKISIREYYNDKSKRKSWNIIAPFRNFPSFHTCLGRIKQTNDGRYRWYKIKDSFVLKSREGKIEGVDSNFESAKESCLEDLMEYIKELP